MTGDNSIDVMTGDNSTDVMTGVNSTDVTSLCLPVLAEVMCH